MSNALMIIFPYQHQKTWVFDDERVGLVQEPFISGVPEIIDILVQDIPNISKGFKLLFSAIFFLCYQAELIWIREEYGGNWYRWHQKDIEAWLCPALFKYFSKAPKQIYCKTKKI